MYTVRIEHAISDFDTWKAAFDRAAGLRQGSGVRRHRSPDRSTTRNT